MDRSYHTMSGPDRQKALSTNLYKPLILGAQKWSGWISVIGEADRVGETRTATPQNGLNEPDYHLREAPGRFALDATGRRYTFLGEGEAQNGNSGLQLSTAGSE